MSPTIKIKNDDKANEYVILYFEEALHYPLFCYYSTRFKDFKPDFSPDEPKVIVEPPDEFFENFSKNDKFGLLWFKENSKFKDLLNNYLHNNYNLTSERNYIIYYEFDENGEWILPNLENSNHYWEPLFYKARKFEIEKEFRFIFLNASAYQINDRKISLENLVENRCTSYKNMMFKISVNLMKI